MGAPPVILSAIVIWKVNRWRQCLWQADLHRVIGLRSKERCCRELARQYFEEARWEALNR